MRFVGLLSLRMPPVLVVRSPSGLHPRHRVSIVRKYSNPASQLIGVDRTGLDEPLVYASTSEDPWFNLSYEEWLFRNTPTTTPILYFYRNRPSVIIGRNQNPWKESTPSLLARDDISLLRRRSGGGAVFHDEGNTNFSIMIPRRLFSRSFGAGIIARAVGTHMGIGEIGVNERGDLVLQGIDADGKDRKVSGSAYKIVSQRAYHHGTMLISSDLGSLGKYLKGAYPDIATKSVDSVRSPVSNLRSVSPKVIHDHFLLAVTKVFREVFANDAEAFKTDKNSIEFIGPDMQRGDDTSSADKWKKIDAGIKELKSWDWVFGQTPEFSQRFEELIDGAKVVIDLTSKHTIINECWIAINGRPAPNLQSVLKGRSYGKLQDRDLPEGLTRAERGVYSWLARATK